MELIDKLMEVKHLDISDMKFTDEIYNFMDERKQNYRFELKESVRLLINFVYRGGVANVNGCISTFGFITNYDLLFIFSIMTESNFLKLNKVTVFYVNNDTENVIMEMDRMMNTHNCYSSDLVRLCDKYMDKCHDKVNIASLLPSMSKSAKK